MCNCGLTYMEVFPSSYANWQGGAGDMCKPRKIFQQLLDTSSHYVWLPGFFVLRHFRVVICWQRGGGDEKYEQTVWPWHSDSGFAPVSPENGLKLLPQSVHHMLSKTAQESALIRSPCISHCSADYSANIMPAHVFSGTLRYWLH